MPASLDLLFAALPIITLIVLLACRVKPLPAVLGAMAVLLVLGFRFPIEAVALAGMSERLLGVTLNVVFILLGGLILSVFAAESGAQQTMSDWFESAARNPDRAILMYGLGLTPFMEAAIGWGVSLILAVPLLLRAGLSGTRAAAVGLLGLVVCPWGSLGPGLMLTAELGDVSLVELGAQTSLFNLPVIVSATVLVAVVGVGKRMTVRLAAELVVVALVMWATLYAVSATIGPALAGIIASIAVILTMLLFARIQGADPRMTLAEAKSFGPFGVLVGAMLLVILLSALIDFGVWAAIITSPGLWLVVCAASAPLFYGMSRDTVAHAVRRGVRRWVPVTTTTVSYILFGVLLSVSGMSAMLADGAASQGLAFLVALPFIGALAGYLTTAVTSVATMLTFGVTDAALSLGADPTAALGVQTAAAGSAVGASPARMIIAVGVAEETLGEGQGQVNLGKVALVTLAMSVLAAAAMSLFIWSFPL